MQEELQHEGENYRRNAIQVKIDRLRTQLQTAGTDSVALLKSRIATLEKSKSEILPSGTATVESETVNSELELVQQQLGQFKAETRGRMLNADEWTTLLNLERRLRACQNG